MVADLDAVAPTRSRFGRAVQRWLESQVEPVGESYADLVELDAEALRSRIEQLRRDAREVFDFSQENRPPLNSRSRGVLTGPAFTVERVLFDSRPNYPVTASLYRPDAATHGRESLPAVLGLCGHAEAGKAYEDYQAFAQSLATHGFVCLLIDPVGQGERAIFGPAPDAGKADRRSPYGGPTSQHNEFGIRAGLAGAFFGQWRAYDASRGVDYLASLPEVDAARIGVTGNSGGGTMTTWLTGLDDRIAFSAPSCFVTDFWSNLRNELPADIEQCPPRTLGRGLDHAGYLLANAPKPLLIVAQEQDFFDVRGTRSAADVLRSVYQTLGAENAFDLHVGPGGHGFHKDGRVAMVNFFLKAIGRDAGVEEPPIEPFTAEELQCTASGQVETDGESRTTWSFLPERCREAREQRADAPLEDRVRQALRLIDVEPHPDVPPRRLRPVYASNPRRPYPRFGLTGAGGCPVIVMKQFAATEPGDSAPVVVHIAGDVSLDELLSPPPSLARAIEANPAAAVYAVDVRGVGETQPRVADFRSYADIYGSDYMHAAYAEMLGRPMLGWRVLDAMTAVRFAASQEGGAIVLSGHGNGAVVARLAHLLLKRGDAAVPAARIGPVQTSGGFESFEQVATRPSDLPPYSVLPFGMLRHFDLTELDH